MALSLKRRPRANTYTSVDIDYEFIRVSVTAREKNQLLIRTAERDLTDDLLETFPENPGGSLPTQEASAKLTLVLRELFAELNAPLTKVGINSPDRNTVLNIFTAPPLKPKDLQSAIEERVSTLSPNNTATRSGFHVLSRTKREVTCLLTIIQSPYADALANVVREAGGLVDLMQPRIVSSLNAITSLTTLPDHPLIIAHISRNATGVAVLKSVTNSPHALQWARFIPLGGITAVQQHERFTRELTDTIQQFRPNIHSPASIILLGREHDNPVIRAAAEAANLTIEDLELPGVIHEGSSSAHTLPSLLGLALTRMNP